MRYDTSWDHLPSVTEVTAILNKPDLVSWYIRSTANQIKETSEKAKKIGTLVHKAADLILRKKEFNIETENLHEVYSCLSGLIAWRKTIDLEVLECELKLKSDILGYKGTLDHVIKVGNENWLIDWKTSAKVYPEYILQVVAYQKLYEASGGKIDRLFIPLLSKNEGKFTLNEITESTEDVFKIFKNLLSIKKWLEGDIKCKTKKITQTSLEESQ